MADTLVSKSSMKSTSGKKYIYNVLFYKRLGKIHKSRADGILSIVCHPSCQITLAFTQDTAHESEDQTCSTSSDEENNDCDDNLNLSSKERNKAIRRKMNNRQTRKNRKRKLYLRQQSKSKSNGITNDNRRVVYLGGILKNEIEISKRAEQNLLSTIVSDCKSSSHSACDDQTLQKSKPIIKSLETNNLGGEKKKTLLSRNIPISGSLNDKRKIRNPLKLFSSSTIKTNTINNRNLYSQSSLLNRRTQLNSNLNIPGSRSIIRKNSKSIISSSIAPFNNSITVGTGFKNDNKNFSTSHLLNRNSKESSSTNDFPGSIGTIQIPNSIKSILQPHQVSGISFLWNCLTGSSPGLRKATQQHHQNKQNNYSGAILADEMGLGKTLMSIAIILALYRKERKDRVIVVCPSSLVSNWAKEFDKWIGKASQPKRLVVQKGGENGLKIMKAFVPVKPQKTEILIISYDLIRINWSMLSKAANIGLLVVDEGHRLKNTSGSATLSALNSFNCKARLLITGTPIQNDLFEFFNVVNFVFPGVGILGDSLNTFRQIYERPLSAANHKNATREEIEKGKNTSKLLETVTSTFMLRRLRNVLTLPPRTEILLFCRPSSTQCRLYKELTQVRVVDKVSYTFQTLTSLRKLCSHPFLVDKSSCNMNDLSVCGKLNVLEGILSSIRSECPTDKVVLVSNFTTALDIIDEFLIKKKGWTCLRLDGTVEQSVRQPLVDSFNRGTVDQSFIFLLSSKAGGCGLNLVGANRLIMYDADWNPSVDLQAMARIYRTGQTKSCFIYRLFTSGTVEEVVYQRQIQKGNLANLAVGKSTGAEKKDTSTQFTKEELRDCFTLNVDCECDTKEKLGNVWNEYDGILSLQAQGCFDEPTLTTAQEKSDTLAFVHIVADLNSTNSSGSNSTNSSQSDACEKQEKAYHLSDSQDSSDEKEFIG